MARERMIRRGALTRQSLGDAMATESAAGRRPVQLAVGCHRLERIAVALLRPTPGTVGVLRSGVPNVIRDDSLPEEGWELREE